MKFKTIILLSVLVVMLFVVAGCQQGGLAGHAFATGIASCNNDPTCKSAFNACVSTKNCEATSKSCITACGSDRGCAGKCPAAYTACASGCYDTAIASSKIDSLAVCKNSQYDYNGDGFVSKKDVSVLASVLMSNQSNQSNQCPAGKICDLNGDGKVKSNDLQAFTLKFTSCLNTCGNGVQELDEKCDGNDGLLEQFCPAGTKGKLGCKADCTFDTSGCVAVAAGPTEICNDNKDNDNNGVTDCDDPACSADLSCKDSDGDGFVDAKDNCPLLPNADESDYQVDTDKDGVGDACDKCPTVYDKDGKGCPVTCTPGPTGNLKCVQQSSFPNLWYAVSEMKATDCSVSVDKSPQYGKTGETGCGVSLDSCVDGKGCCTTSVVSSTCQGDKLVNITQNSCTGQGQEVKDCSLQGKGCGMVFININGGGYSVKGCFDKLNPPATCTDSDIGNYWSGQNDNFPNNNLDLFKFNNLYKANMTTYTKGSVTANGTEILIDKCLSGTLLQEAVCTQDSLKGHPGGFGYYDCALDGTTCKDGACVNLTASNGGGSGGY